MSAFIVDKVHIDAMLAAGIRHGRYDDLRWFAREYGCDGFEYESDVRTLNLSSTDTVGQMLVDECVRSVCGRYPDNEPLPGPCDPYYMRTYQYPRMRPGRPPTPVEALKLIDCYEYQSCEHDAWKDSEAKRFCEALRSRLIGALPGYDDADWEYRPEVLA